MEEIELLNNEIEDFMQKVPSAIVRYGTGLMFFLVLILIFGSAIFKYPNIVKAPVTILAGRTVWFTVERTNHQIVTTDDTLTYKEIMKLKFLLAPGAGKIVAEKTGDLKNIQLWEKKHMRTMLIHEKVRPGPSSPGTQLKPLMKSGVLSATLKLTPSEVGKVKVGQRAIIKLEKYPYSEFGALEGKIDDVSSQMTSPDGKEHYYEATVFFPDGLITSFHKRLSADNQMVGSADIITNNETLLQRILKPIYAIRSETTTK
jgi:hypothetical protein